MARLTARRNFCWPGLQILALALLPFAALDDANESKLTLLAKVVMHVYGVLAGLKILTSSSHHCDQSKRHPDLVAQEAFHIYQARLHLGLSSTICAI